MSENNQATTRVTRFSCLPEATSLRHTSSGRVPWRAGAFRLVWRSVTKDQAHIKQPPGRYYQRMKVRVVPERLTRQAELGTA